MTATDTQTPMSHVTHDHRNWFARAEGWLDARGKPAWIGAMVLGFIFFWPVGLALLAYMVFFKKKGGMSGHRSRRMGMGINRMTGSSGNTAFDAYKDETLRRLEQEQTNFEAFLERLRDAKDKAEFDQFMDDRAKKADDTDPSDDKNAA